MQRTAAAVDRVYVSILQIRPQLQRANLQDATNRRTVKENKGKIRRDKKRDRKERHKTRNTNETDIQERNHELYKCRHTANNSDHSSRGNYPRHHLEKEEKNEKNKNEKDKK